MEEKLQRNSESLLESCWIFVSCYMGTYPHVVKNCSRVLIKGVIEDIEIRSQKKRTRWILRLLFL